MKATNNYLAQVLLRGTYQESPAEAEKFIKKFIAYLSSCGRKKDLNRILDHYASFYDEKAGIIRAEVSAKETLDQEVRLQIEKFIKTRAGRDKKVIITQKQEEDLLGGVKIRVGNKIWDLTIKNRLNQLKNIIS